MRIGTGALRTTTCAIAAPRPPSIAASSTVTIAPVSRRKLALTGLLGSFAALAGRSPAKAAASAQDGGGRRSYRLTPEEVAHRLEIDDLLTRYTIAVDDEQFDLLDTVFTPDAVIDYTSGGGPRGPYPEVKAWLSRGLSTGNPARMHMIGNKQVSINGSTAIVRAYFFNP